MRDGLGARRRAGIWRCRHCIEKENRDIARQPEVREATSLRAAQ